MGSTVMFKTKQYEGTLSAGCIFMNTLCPACNAAAAPATVACVQFCLFFRAVSPKPRLFIVCRFCTIQKQHFSIFCISNQLKNRFLRFIIHANQRKGHTDMALMESRSHTCSGHAMPASQHDSFAMLLKDAAFAVSFFAILDVISIIRIIIVRLLAVVMGQFESGSISAIA